MGIVMVFGAVFFIIILTSSSIAYGLTASEFVSKYKTDFSKGKWINVSVKVRGEPESDDPSKRAKEIRFLQAGVLKFIHLAGAKNVKSDTWKNEFTAHMTTSLAEVIAQRSDVLSVIILDEISEKEPEKNCTTFHPGADLSGCDLYGINLSFVDLRGVNLSGANLKGANLISADLSGADLAGARLSYASLDFANLTNANLTSAWMVGTDIRNADLSGAELYRATMWRADFTSSNLSFVDLRFSILSYAVLAFVNLEGADLENSGTWNTNLNHCFGHKICE